MCGRFFTSLHKTAILYISSQDGPSGSEHSVHAAHLDQFIFSQHQQTDLLLQHPPCPLCLHLRVCVYIHVRNTCTSPLPENAAVTTPTAVTTLTAVTTHAHRHLPFTYAFICLHADKHTSSLAHTAWCLMPWTAFSLTSTRCSLGSVHALLMLDGETLLSLLFHCLAPL